MTHPHNLHAAAALWSLHAARRHYAAHRTALVIQRPQYGPAASRPRTLAELHAHDTLLREERAERAAGSLRGLKPTASHAAPVSPGLLDLDRDIEQTLVDVLDLVAYANRTHPYLRHAPGEVWTWYAGSRPAGRDLYLAATLPVTPSGIAGEAAVLLERIDARVRALLGLPPDHWRLPLAPRCPTCRERLLRVQTSAQDARRWTVVCTSGSCRCLGDGDQGAGDGCPCGMPVRAAGVAHIWAADSPLAVSAFAGAALIDRTAA